MDQDWTIFHCSCQGKFANPVQIGCESLKRFKITFPEVFCGRCAGLRTGSHVHLQCMDKITGTTCNIMQSNTNDVPKNYHMISNICSTKTGNCNFTKLVTCKDINLYVLLCPPPISYFNVLEYMKSRV